MDDSVDTGLVTGSADVPEGSKSLRNDVMGCSDSVTFPTVALELEPVRHAHPHQPHSFTPLVQPPPATTTAASQILSK